MADLIKPQQLNDIMIAADDAKAREEKAYREKTAAQKKALQEAFMSREIIRMSHSGSTMRFNVQPSRATVSSRC